MVKTYAVDVPVNSYELALRDQAHAAGLRFVDDPPPVVSVHDLPPAQAFGGQMLRGQTQTSIFDGEKFYGGFGPTQLMQADYWTLRARSAQLFNENLYARGIVRRLLTNEINTGLTPEAAPDEEILGLKEDSLVDWTERSENRFGLWGRSPEVCDFKKQSTFGEIQRQARLEALVDGDVLVVLRQNAATRLPCVQLVSGSSVLTPIGYQPRTGNTIKHGVEFNSVGREVGYHVRQADGTFKRLPAYGEKYGRRIAWLVFGTEKRLDDVRGTPLLSLVLQSLKEIDRYRDSAQRKAVVNSIMAMFITKSSDKPGTLPMTGGAVRRDSVVAADPTTGSAKRFTALGQIPGVIAEELQEGEKPEFNGGQGTDINFGVFEEAIVQAIAWAVEMPPEILRLAFSNNYSASQAAINEFKIYLNKIWSKWGEEFCSPIWSEWLISEALNGKNDAPGLLDAWRDPMQWDVLAAWTYADWYGSIKPSTDMAKQTKGSEALVKNGWSTNAREARVLTGTKFSKNVKRLRSEVVQLVDVMRPMLELQAEFGQVNLEEIAEKTASRIGDIVAEANQAEREM